MIGYDGNVCKSSVEFKLYINGMYVNQDLDLHFQRLRNYNDHQVFILYFLKIPRNRNTIGQEFSN